MGSGGPSLPGASGGGGISSGGRSGGRSVGAAPRLTFFEWTEVQVTPMTVVTPEPGSSEEEMTPEKHLQQVMGVEQALRRGDKRPILVYFHWPHDHETHGRLTTTLCERTLDDEEAARWGRLYRLVQVDMGASDADMAEALGCTGKPGFVALDPETLEVKAKIAGAKSASKLRKGLASALKKFRTYWREVRERLEAQGEMLEEAKRLEKADDLDGALELVDKVRFGDLRIGEHFDRAQAYGQLLAQKSERAGD